jgi:tetratricopeptide (TPR) repeat protein
MIKLHTKKYFILCLLSCLAPVSVFADANQDLLYNSYREYLKTSQEYVSTQKEASEQLRNWRKKRLAEIFNDKLDGTEQTLLMSNSNLIEEFNKFLKENGVDSLDDVLLIRLSQLYFEKANLEFNLQMKKSQEKEGSDEIPVPNYDQAIRFSKIFISKYSTSPIADKAYYLLGFAAEEMGKSTESIGYYEALLKNYPASEFAEEVAWRLAEIFYGDAKYAKAEEMYQRLVKIKGHFFTKAMYKLGATYFSQKKILDSSEIFQNLITEISSYNTPSQEDQAILDESYEYLATLLSNNHKVEIKAEYQPEVYYRLGLLYKKRLDEKSMRSVFITAAQKFPKSRQLPLIYTELIESFDSVQDTESANTYRSQFVQALTQDQKWWTENEDYKNIVFETQDLLEFNLIKSAEYYAEKGYLKNNYEQLKIAKNRYFNFITKYPWSTYRDYAKLELADLEYYLSNYTQASNYYFEIVNEAVSPTLREEAAYSLIWSEVKKSGYNLNFDAKSSMPQNAQKTSLVSNEKVFTQAAIFYINKIKTSSRKNKVIYKLAEVYAEHGDFDSSAQYLNMIIADTENSDAITVSAYRFLMEIYNLKNDWSSLTSISEQYNSAFFAGDIEALDKDNFRQKFRDKLETAYNFELEGKYLEAALEFEKVIVENPRSPMTDFLNLKIAAFYIKTGQYSRAKNICNQLLNTKYKVESQFLISQILYKTVRVEDAAKALEDFVLANKKHPWFEAALLNVISLRSQMNAEEKTIALIKKINPENLSSYTFYSYIKALLDTKKYEDLYKVVNSTKGKTKYDSYRLQYFALKAQHDRYDYVGLDRTCTGLEKALSNARSKTAYGSLNKSFCEYAKLKTIVGQSDVSLEDIVSKLNSIYSYKIDSTTILALNEIVSNSDLKNTYKTQFDQLIQKGWSIAKLYPFSEETKKLSQTILSYNGKLPLSLSYMMNWKVSLSELLEYQSFKGKDVKQFCDSKQYAECLAGLKEIEKTDKSSEVYENLIVTSLKMNDDEELQHWMSEYLSSTDSSERSQIYANYLGMNDKIPEKNKGIQLSTNEPMSLSAKAMELWSNKQPKDAIDLLLKALDTNPESPYPYYILSQIYFDRGYSELARTVVLNGYANSESHALMPLVYQLAAVTSSATVLPASEARRDQSPAESFAIAFAALKNKNDGALDKSYKAVKSYKSWFDTIKTLELVYNNSNTFKPQEKNLNLYSQWLEALYKLSQGTEPLSLDKVSALAQKNQVVPNFREIERTVSGREVAGDKK